DKALRGARDLGQTAERPPFGAPRRRGESARAHALSRLWLRDRGPCSRRFPDRRRLARPLLDEQTAHTGARAPLDTARPPAAERTRAYRAGFDPGNRARRRRAATSLGAPHPRRRADLHEADE